MSVHTMILPHRVHDTQSLIEKLRQVPTRGNHPIIYPYRDSLISLVTVDPRVLSPCQRYVLVPELKKVERVYWEMLAWGVDILHFTEDRAYVEGIDHPACDILPVIVEEQFVSGRLHMLVCDGQHRCFLAHQLHTTITVVYIRGVSEPYYAYPLRKGWDEVEIISQLTSDYIKKFHSYWDYKRHFRDFTKVFNNQSVSRPTNPDPQITLDKSADIY